MLQYLRLSFTGSLAVAANNLDPIRGERRLIVQLEGDIFNEECPDIVAKAVGIEMALKKDDEY